MFRGRVEATFTEINLRKKWLLGCSYNLHKSKIENHLNKIKFILDSFSSKYENVLLMGDFNMEPMERNYEWFYGLKYLKNLVRVPTSSKNSEKPTCVDIFHAFETGFEHFLFNVTSQNTQF